MTSSPTRRTPPPTRATRAASVNRSTARPIVIYTSQSVDGTSFGLDPESQVRIRNAFPDVRISTRHVYISHDTREKLSESINRFDKQVVSLLTGLSAEQLTKKFIVSFRDPRSEQEIAQLVPEPKVA